MEIVCKSCNTSHFLSDDRIPLETKTGKCKQCSAPITVLGKNATVSIEPTPIQSTPPEPEATKNCDFCGEKILAIAKKCRHCGSMLYEINADNSQVGAKPPEDVTPSGTDNVVDDALVHKTGDNPATRQWRKKTKIIVIVFLLTISLVLTWYVEVYEVVTTIIEERNGIIYIPNSDEPFTGKYQEFYSNGQKKREASYKDGKLDGLITGWFENGQKELEGNYKDGKQDGLATGWHDNGQKQVEENHKDGKQDGLATGWYDNGQKEWERNYKDGKQDGLTTWWSENGQKKSEENYKDGKLDGLSTWWFENGQKKYETNYKDGKPVL
ncbi:MAG: MJ0042-type zinc finger domain-containing protein [Methylococcales bacterium]